MYGSVQGMFRQLGSDNVIEKWEGQTSLGGPLVLRLVEIQSPGLHVWRVQWRMARTGGETFDTEAEARTYLAEQLATQPGMQRVI